MAKKKTIRRYHEYIRPQGCLPLTKETPEMVQQTDRCHRGHLKDKVFFTNRKTQNMQRIRNTNVQLNETYVHKELPITQKKN